VVRRFVALLPFYGWLGRHDHRVWLWTCLAGWILGLIGLVLVRKHPRPRPNALDRLDDLTVS